MSDQDVHRSMFSTNMDRAVNKFLLSARIVWLHVGPLTVVKRMPKRVNQNRNVGQAESSIPAPSFSNLAKQLHRITEVQASIHL